MFHDNRALACIEGGVYIGSGFIIAAVTQAEILPLSCLFFVLGETAIVVFSSVYQWATEWNDRAAVESKNIAAGAHWGISLIAIGLLLSRALYLSQSLYTFALWFFLGSPVLLAVIHVVDLMIFPNLKISSGLSGAGKSLPANSVAPEPADVEGGTTANSSTHTTRPKRSKSMMPRSMTSTSLLSEGSALVADDGSALKKLMSTASDQETEEIMAEGKWGVSLVAGVVMVSVAQLLNTMLRDCAFEFGVH